MKVVPYFDIYLLEFSEVSAAKCAAVIDQKASVGNICCLKRYSPALAKFLAQGEVHRRVNGQVYRAFAIENPDP